MSDDTSLGVSSRGTIPVVAVTAMLAITVVLAAVTGGMALSRVPDDSPASAALSLSVQGDRLTLTHDGGGALDVRDVELRVTVNGTPLTSQPPVPFFSAPGFRPGPTGPFNAAADPTWTAGEAASVRVAGTNNPALGPGASVEVGVYTSGRPVAALAATAQAVERR